MYISILLAFGLLLIISLKTEFLVNNKLNTFIKFVLFTILQPPQTSTDTRDEASRQTEIPTLTVSLPIIQTDMLGHSGASTAGAQATTNRMV
jgi:hypothetical protein